MMNSYFPYLVRIIIIIIISKIINICNKINNIVLNEDISTSSISVPTASSSLENFPPPSIGGIYNYIITSNSSSF